MLLMSPPENTLERIPCLCSPLCCNDIRALVENIFISTWSDKTISKKHKPIVTRSGMDVLAVLRRDNM